MKKKLLVLLMTGIVAAGSITACGSKSAGTTTAAETTAAATTAAETSAADAKEETTTAAGSETSAEAAAEGDFAANFDTYLSWTGKEWSAATESEKENAAIAYSIYLTEIISGQEFDKAEIGANLDAAKASGQMPTLIKELDANFTTMDISLKEFSDLAAAQLAEMTSEAAK